jgi:hypothetical protein
VLKNGKKSSTHAVSTPIIERPGGRRWGNGEPGSPGKIAGIKKFESKRNSGWTFQNPTDTMPDPKEVQIRGV